MAGDRQLVRQAVAAYFGGTLVTTDAGICYQNGPLAASGLGTAYPYEVKGVPDEYYFIGEAAGSGWGAVMGVTRARRITSRVRGGGMGGPTSGFRNRFYAITCTFVVISQERHVETAEAEFDDLVDLCEALIYADRTLGTTNKPSLYPNPPYWGNRLIIQAGEGAAGVESDTLPFVPEKITDPHSRFIGSGSLSFEVVTTIAA